MSMLPQTRSSWFRTLRRLPLVSELYARVRRSWYDRGVRRFARVRDGRAGQLPQGVVYEPTMRCNLRCEFCYTSALLNLEGQWRGELGLETIDCVFPARPGMLISLTGGEVFIRNDSLEILDLFARKSYVCRYLTTNGTFIDDARATALARLARRGFLKHVSVSIDGPGDFHDAARGMDGAFARTAAGLRRLQDAVRREGAPLHLSINTTVSAESLDTLDRMADVAVELGVKAIGVNHLIFATPEEAEQTARIIGAPDTACIVTYVTRDPGIDAGRVRRKMNELAGRCRENGIEFGFRPNVQPSVMENYYTPGAPMLGQCFYPFLHTRVGFGGKVYFCPFIRAEVGDLTTQTLAEIWNGRRYVDLRRLLLEHKLFPVCRRCCKADLFPEPVPFVPGAGPRTIPLTLVR
jgi:MoaA/NifB/PqqE/SkfB family radical SAM enzyme